MLSASRLLRRSSRLLTSDAKAPLALHGILSLLHEIGPISFTSFKSNPDKPRARRVLRYYLAQRHWFGRHEERAGPNSTEFARRIRCRVLAHREQLGR